MLNKALVNYFMYINMETGEESLRFKSAEAMRRVRDVDYTIGPNTIVKEYEVLEGLFGSDISIDELVSLGYEVVSPGQEIDPDKMYDVYLDMTNGYFIIRRTELILDS